MYEHILYILADKVVWFLLSTSVSVSHTLVLAA